MVFRFIRIMPTTNVQSIVFKDNPQSSVQAKRNQSMLCIRRSVNEANKRYSNDR